MRIHHTRRRTRLDPLATVDEPRWLVIRDHLATLLESMPIAAGEDIRVIFVAAALRRMTEGWIVEDFGPPTSIFFCARHGVRVSVGITQVDPIGPEQLGNSSANYVRPAIIFEEPR
jgi:hypothetical protein